MKKLAPISGINPSVQSFSNQYSNKDVNTNNIALKTPLTEDKVEFQTKPELVKLSVQEKKLSNIEDKILIQFAPKKFIEKYLNKDFIQKAIDKNPKIQEILTANNMELNIQPENVMDIADSHLLPSYQAAKKIINQNKEDFTQQEIETILMATLLHDIGKMLIPKDLLNKKEKLTQQEKHIIDLHSELGYEILKSTAIPQNVLSIIKNHHNDTSDKLTNVIKTADIYSALMEERAYKGAMSSEEAVNILNKTIPEKKYVQALVA